MYNPVFPAGPHALVPRGLGAQTSLSQTLDSERVSCRTLWPPCPPVMEEKEENQPKLKGR